MSSSAALSTGDSALFSSMEAAPGPYLVSASLDAANNASRPSMARMASCISPTRQKPVFRAA